MVSLGSIVIIKDVGSMEYKFEKYDKKYRGNFVSVGKKHLYFSGTCIEMIGRFFEIEVDSENKAILLTPKNNGVNLSSKHQRSAQLPLPRGRYNFESKYKEGFLFLQK